MHDDCHHGDPPAKPSGCTCSGATGGDRSECPVCAPQPHAKMVPITDKRAFDFSNVYSGTEVYVVLCPALCVLAYTRLRLSVRVHALTMTSGQLLRFYMWNTLPSDEDPAQEFVGSTELTTADITSATTVPSLVTSALVEDPDAYVKISVRATQTSVPSTLTATLSVSLLLRRD